MGCLVIGLYVLGFLFFFLIGMAAWSEGERLVSVIIYILSFVFVFLLIKKAPKKNNKIITMDKEIEELEEEEKSSFTIEIKSSYSSVEVSDEELQEMQRKSNLKTDAVISQPGIKYIDIKYIKYNGEEFDISYNEEINICSNVLYRLFNLYMELKDSKDIYYIEKEFEKYTVDYKRFLKIKERKDFIKIYREAKYQYRHALDSSFSMALTKAVNNPELFNIDFDKLCVEAVKNYREYWLDVLHNYKRKSAFENRKIYLFDTINTIMTYKCLSNKQEAQDILKDFSVEVNNQTYNDNVS